MGRPKKRPETADKVWLGLTGHRGPKYATSKEVRAKDTPSLPSLCSMSPGHIGGGGKGLKYV